MLRKNIVVDTRKMWYRFHGTMLLRSMAAKRAIFPKCMVDSSVVVLPKLRAIDGDGKRCHAVIEGIALDASFFFLRRASFLKRLPETPITISPWIFFFLGIGGKVTAFIL